MAKIDVAKAAFAGFGVIARHPVAVLVWGLLLAAVGILPFLLIMGGFMSSFADLAAMENGAEPTPEAMMPMMSAMMLLHPIMFLLSIAQQAVLGAAVCRAVLEPENRSWFYLRFGVQELWLALVSVVIFVLVMIAGVVLAVVAVPVMVIGFITSPDNPGIAVLIMAPLLLAACVAFLWLSLRFSMGLPMTFAARQFRLFESWAFTRGHGGSLFIIALILIAMMMALYVLLLIVLGVAVVIGAGAASGGFDPVALEAYFNQDAKTLMQAVIPWILVGSVVAYIVVAAMFAICMAPWAEVYRQLRDQPAPAGPAIAA